eukprot:Rhum_TRINITY_DN11332_c0_g1::Rhum_TRINITY_DN11332_c0_g1_i1::g.43986::m.43986
MRFCQARRCSWEVGRVRAFLQTAPVHRHDERAATAPAAAPGTTLSPAGDDAGSQWATAQVSASVERVLHRRAGRGQRRAPPPLPPPAAASRASAAAEADVPALLDTRAADVVEDVLRGGPVAASDVRGVVATLVQVGRSPSARGGAAATRLASQAAVAARLFALFEAAAAAASLGQRRAHAHKTVAGVVVSDAGCRRLLEAVRVGFGVAVDAAGGAAAAAAAALAAVESP